VSIDEDRLRDALAEAADHADFETPPYYAVERRALHGPLPLPTRRRWVQVAALAAAVLVIVGIATGRLPQDSPRSEVRAADAPLATHAVGWLSGPTPPELGTVHKVVPYGRSTYLLVSPADDNDEGCLWQFDRRSQEFTRLADPPGVECTPGGFKGEALSLVSTGDGLLLWGALHNDTFLGGSFAARFDPAAGTWTVVSAGLLPPVEDFAAAWTGRELLIWGGIHFSRTAANGDGPNTPTASMSGALFDPASGAWREMPNPPLAPRVAPVAIWSGQRFVVWGGTSVDGSSGFADGAAYDPSTNRWKNISSGPLRPRVSAATAVVENRVLIWGGASPDYTEAYGNGAFYDAFRDTWASTAVSALMPRESAAATADEITITIVGGVVQNGSASTTMRDGASLDAATGTWRHLGGESGPAGRVAVASDAGEIVAFDSEHRFWMRRTSDAPGVPCPRLVLRRVDGGNPSADALPNIADTERDSGAAQRAFDADHVPVAGQFRATVAVLGAGYGKAWTGVNGGEYSVVDISDYALLLVVPEGSCPTAPAVRRTPHGLPIFLFTPAAS
jgi:hypothetical protein